MAKPQQDLAEPVFIKIPEKVIFLSFFEGVVSAAILTGELTQGVSHQDCMAVLHRHFPDARYRGDFLKDDPAQVSEHFKTHDPTGQLIALFASAPPCPDFSQITDDAPGSEGLEGQKFTAYCSFAAKAEALIPHKRIAHLKENVVMEKGEADFFSSKLQQCQAVVRDSQQ